jgi:hypothetical protein
MDTGPLFPARGRLRRYDEEQRFIEADRRTGRLADLGKPLIQDYSL